MNVWNISAFSFSLFAQYIMKGTVPSKKRLSTIPEGGNYSAVRRDVKMTGRQMRDAVRDEAVATSSSQSIKASQSNTEPLSVLSKGKI